MTATGVQVISIGGVVGETLTEEGLITWKARWDVRNSACTGSTSVWTALRLVSTHMSSSPPHFMENHEGLEAILEVLRQVSS